MKYIKWLSELSICDISKVGGKAASLGELILNCKNLEINVPDGFVITADAYFQHLKNNKIDDFLNESNIDCLKIKSLIESSPFSDEILFEIKKTYKEFKKKYKNSSVAVRSSSTLEDLPEASFAGQQDSFLNILNEQDLIESVKKCMASLFNLRAFEYRNHMNFSHKDISIAVCIQKMVRSDKSSSGIVFTVDPESSFENVIVINSAFGFGDSIVSGKIVPDEFHVSKTILNREFFPIIKKTLGSKLKNSVTFKNGTILKNLKLKKRNSFSLTDEDIIKLSKLALKIEAHYSKIYNKFCPMDIEFAKDGFDQEIYIVQARPETIYFKKNNNEVVKYYLENKNEKIIARGQAIGQKIASGIVRVIENIDQLHELKNGEILVSKSTDPDWTVAMKRACAIITENGSRTCHTAIVSRELGICAIVATQNITDVLKTGDEITIDCSNGSQGLIYSGSLKINKKIVKLAKFEKIDTKIYLNCAMPDRAYSLASLPCDGVGLARVEFIISDEIKIHPMAFVNFEKIKNKKIKKEIEKISIAYKSPEDFFISQLSMSIASIVSSFYPKPVIVRFSDFKSNEYRNLIAGSFFEPIEENPMIGLRGASRYYHESYKEAFKLECKAFLKVIEDFGLENMIVMVPFVRTVKEAKIVNELLIKYGLKKDNGKLKIYMMCELPSNVMLLEEFAPYFDGFSIGSNDLTQTTLAVDRDSGLLNHIFDERDPAVLKMLSILIKKAKKIGKPIGICGQAPSDHQEIADFLIKQKINSISLNPDSLFDFLQNNLILDLDCYPINGSQSVDVRI